MTVDAGALERELGTQLTRLGGERAAIASDRLTRRSGFVERRRQVTGTGRTGSIGDRLRLGP